MEDLGVKRVVATFEWLLLPEQREYAAVANYLILTATSEPDFLKKVITLNGTEASLSCVQCSLCLESSSINFCF